MPQRPSVPKFGNWDNDDSASYPYSQIFEKARKGRSEGKTMNPNDPLDNPEAFHTDAQPVGTSSYTEARKPSDGLHVTREEGYYQSRVDRISGGSDYGGNHSPLHPSFQMNSNIHGSSEFMSEGNSAFVSNSAGTLRMTSIENDEAIKGSAVPKFGEWDESNPYSADNYSIIFNNVREKKQREGKKPESAEVPNVSGNKTYDNSGGSSRQFSGWWCFSWCKK